MCVRSKGKCRGEENEEQKEEVYCINITLELEVYKKQKETTKKKINKVKTKIERKNL